MIPLISSMLALGIVATPALADSPFLWSSPTAIAPAETYIVGVSCLSTPLCIAMDHKGDVLTASAATRDASDWTLGHVGVTPSGIACVAPEFCVVVDQVGAGEAGSLVVSSDAGAMSPTWAVTQNVDPTGPMSAASCVSPSFCVAVDDQGNVLKSIDPAGDASTWVLQKVDPNFRVGSRANAIESVSCPSTALCVAVDSAGNVLVSTNPTAEEPTWIVRSIEGDTTIFGVSCPATSLCVAVDGGGNVLTSTEPASESPTAWTANFRVDTHALNGVSCVLPATCVAVDAAGNVVTSTASTGGNSAWTVTNVDGIHKQLNAVSCESLQTCVAVDSAGNVITGSPAPSRSLSVAVEGTGSGLVTGAGISCPGSCSSSELNGANVVLTAAPSAGSSFVGWSGACTGMGPCDLTINSPESVIANFAAKPVGPPTSGGNASGASGTNTPTAAAKVTVAGAIVSLPAGVGMPLHCWAKTGRCPPTTLTLSIVESFRGKQLVATTAGSSNLRREHVIVGRTTVTLSAGQTRTAHVTLNRLGKAQLRRLRRLSALLQIRSQTGTVIWNQTVGLLEKTKRKHG